METPKPEEELELYQEEFYISFPKIHKEDAPSPVDTRTDNNEDAVNTQEKETMDWPHQTKLLFLVPVKRDKSYKAMGIVPSFHRKTWKT
ncbi:hypothetical protein NPIL_385321 [Nephila pilipes]|uniref:Uncharacterized protein n=1 Tax=Nephila pilipes TaxID=299642 RepID=A0A8X6PMB6_NEPPI|nr:hypothetical protein NPIL_385321 [Nephila pilipes]